MFDRILIAIDASDHSQHAVPTAAAIARKFGSDVYVLHVSEHDRGRAAVFSTETPAEATRLVGETVRGLRDTGVAATGSVHDVAVGHVARDIVQTAANLGCDLIVMGSRGLSDVQGLLLGSVTHKVMQLAPIAVLVARGPEKARVEERVQALAGRAALA